jgi:hypothetical protein
MTIKLAMTTSSIGLSFKDHSQGLSAVDNMLGGTVLDSWITWRVVIERVWTGEPEVAANFADLARKITKRRERLTKRYARRAAVSRFFREYY